MAARVALLRPTGMGAAEGGRAGSLADPHRARVERALIFRARSANKEDCQASCHLSPRVPDRSSWFSHAQGVEQFGEPLFREDFLFFGHLAHGLA